MSGVRVTGDVLDRAAGALVGLAAGDALGAPYEFSVPGRGAEIVLKAGGPWELGEWTDDTAQAVAIAEVAATGTLDTGRVGQRLLDWFHDGPKGVGSRPRRCRPRPRGPRAAARRHPRRPRAAGQGPCPVLIGSSGGSRHRDPHGFSDGNGFVVTALQAAWAVISQTPVPADGQAGHLQACLQEAVRIGNDTDTVAAIAGQLLGACWGVSAIPWRWRRHLHGWPDLREDDLVRLAVLTVQGGRSDGAGWPDAASLLPWARRQQPRPVCVALPDPHGGDDAGVLLGNFPGLEPALERRGRGRESVPDRPRGGARRCRACTLLAGRPARRGGNQNLTFVLGDVAEAVATLRSEGKRVFVHCVGGRSRTAAAAASYLARRDGTPLGMALATVDAVLPEVRLNPRFAEILR